MERSRIFTIAIIAALLVGVTYWMSKSPLHARTQGPNPVWLEADSAAAIESRTRADFPMTKEEAYEVLKKDYPDLTPEQLDDYIKLKYVETLKINDTLRVHRKAPRNLKLLNPEMSGGFPGRGSSASEKRIAYVDSVLDYYSGRNPEGAAHSVLYSFQIRVPYDAALEGDSLRVWMPLPLKTQRQSKPEIIEASHPYILSDGHSVHNTLFMTAPAPAEKGDTSVFEYTARFTTRGEFFPEAVILKNMKPYDKESDIYRRYTAFEAPHIIRMDSLAKAITGGETNPYRQSELVFDYIRNKYPWAGAREYSTLRCIPEYVVREGHGDCGQVSLLYISLMRSLGVPARWESGWMLHPGEKNLHDWAEVYFEGTGWVPVDVSFGRYSNAENPLTRGFYSHGMDAHRFATNNGVCGPLFPAKRFVRSETVDFQLGEVESSKGNLFYPGWDQTFRLIEVKPVEK